MELRFYIVEKIGTGTEEDPVRPNRIGDIVGLRFATMDYGLENLMLVGAWTSAAQHAALSAQADVYVVPPLGQAVGANPVLNQTRNRIEGFGIPGQWILATTTYREIIGKTGHFCMLSQRLRGLASKRLYEPGMNLGSSITAAYAEQLRQVGQSLNLDPSVVTTGMTLRAALHALEAQMPGFWLAGEHFTGQLPFVTAPGDNIPVVLSSGRLLTVAGSTLASDDFERGTPGNETPIGPNWTPSIGGMEIFNGRVRGTTALNNYLFWNANTFHANHRSQVRWVDGGFEPSNGPTVRFGAAGNGYALVLRSNQLAPTDIRIARIDANAFTLLQTLPGLPQHQTNYTLQVINNELRAFHEGVQFGSVVTDATHASGQPGMRNFGASGWLDDWIGSDRFRTPLVVGVETGANVAIGTKILNLPAPEPGDTGVGDLLIAIYAQRATDAQTWTAGWTLAGASGTNVVQVRYRVADGTEGSTISVSGSTFPASWTVFRIKAGTFDPDIVPVVAVQNTDAGTNTGHDPPPVTPPGGAKHYLSIVAMAINGGDSITAVPAGYANSTFVQSEGAGGTAGSGMGTARRVAVVATEDPLPFTLSGTNSSRVFTIMVQPSLAPPDAPAVGPPGEIADLVATPATGQINLSWTPAAGAASHRIERRVVS